MKNKGQKPKTRNENCFNKNKENKKSGCRGIKVFLGKTLVLFKPPQASNITPSNGEPALTLAETSTLSSTPNPFSLKTLTSRHFYQSR